MSDETPHRKVPPNPHLRRLTPDLEAKLAPADQRSAEAYDQAEAVNDKLAQQQADTDAIPVAELEITQSLIFDISKKPPA